jgi:hypothetical protein
LTASVNYFTGDRNFVVGTFVKKHGFSSEVDRFIFAGVVVKKSNGKSKYKHYL